MKQDALLELRGISKRFGGNVALDGLSMDLREGEILTLLGENGAGKSTLLNILSGSLKADSGEILLDGQKVHLPSPHAAKRMGIVKVHQELQILPEMTVAENVFLGNELLHPVTRAVWQAGMRQQADELLATLDADFESAVLARTLSTAQKQLVEIAKALLNEFSVLILDEPTSSLTNKEIDKLFSIMERLRGQGKSIIFVSHRLEEVFQVSDRITVLRDGKYIGTVDGREASREQLIQMMTGRDLSNIVNNTTGYEQDQVVLRVESLTSAEDKFRDISFELHRGEILGFSGLVGSGRTEIMRAVFGADKIAGGAVYLEGQRVHIRSPQDSLRLGLALIPEDRKLQGMIGMLPNEQNISLSSYKRLTTHGILKGKAIRENTDKFLKMLNVHPPIPSLPTGSLSGGNQQKIVIAKWLSTDAKIIIMDEPTRGIDVGAKHEIYKLMMDLSSRGVSIIMISSELPEIIGLSHRILVVHEGKLVAEVKHEDATEEKILHYAMGGDTA